MFRTLPAAAALALAASIASAQIATSLVNEGDPVPGMAGFTFGSLNNPAVNGIGGYAITTNIENGVDTISLMWGKSNQVSATGVLYMEQTVAGFAQTSWESFAGIDNQGNVAYSATVDNGLGDPSADSAWLNGTPLAVEGLPASVAGQFWRFASRPNITPSGMPWFVGGLSSTAGGNTENRGLFVGLGATALYIGGDTVPPFVAPLSTASTVSFDLGFSEDGTQHIVEVQLANGDSFADNAIVISGTGLSLGGTLVQEGNLVPVSVGGDGLENWDNFDFMGINNSGDYFFSGDTNGDTATDEILVFNGQVLYREGDLVDGQVLSGSIEGAWLTAAGDLAFIWDINNNADEALFVNGQLLLTDGDSVDLDGDGSLDAGTAISSFTGLSVLRQGADCRVYFTADIDTLGTSTTTDDTEGFYRLSINGTPKTYCTAKASSSGCLASITSSNPLAQPTSGADNYDVIANQVEGLRAGIFFYGVSGAAELPFNGGFLCVDPTIGLGRTPVQFSAGSADNCDGQFVQTINDGTLTGLDLGPGTSNWIQTWYRDPALMDGFDTALSNAIQVDFQ